MEYSSGGNAIAAIVLVFLSICLPITIGVFIWYLWAMSRLFPRIGLNRGEGWIPVWNQWKLLDRTGMPGWTVLLAFVGLGAVPLVMLIIAMHRLGKEYGAGAGYTVLGVFIPPLWATLFANVAGKPGQTFARRQTGYGATAIPAAGAPAQFAPPARPGSATTPVPWAAAGAAGSQYVPPQNNVPPQYAPPQYAPPQSPPSVPEPVAPPVHPLAGGLPLLQPPVSPPAAPPKPVQTVPTPAPTPVPFTPKPSGITGSVNDLPAADATQVVNPPATPGEADADFADLDSTIVVPRRKQPVWVLELPDGTELPVDNDVVIGRKPESIGDSSTLTVPDRTRTLSKSHVRLVRDGEGWFIEDLDSTNGLVLMSEDGSEDELSPGVRAEATERMLFGTLEVKLRPGGEPT